MRALLEMSAERWSDCFNRHDLEGLLALYDEQAAHLETGP